jgi:histidinol-phosphatase
VLIGLEDQGEPVVGVAHFPVFAETYWGSRGGGAYRNDERLALNSEGMFDFLDRLWIARDFEGSRDKEPVVRGKGELWYERRGELWDLAPLQIIVEEAGGRFFAPDGARRCDGGRAFLCSEAVERRVRNFLGLE